MRRKRQRDTAITTPDVPDPSRVKKARAEPFANPLPAGPADTPYVATLHRMPGSTALKLIVEEEGSRNRTRTRDNNRHRSPFDCSTRLTRCDHVQDPTEGHTWHRGDIGEIGTTDGDTSRVLLLGIAQEKAELDGSEVDTFFAVSWLYTPEEAKAEGIQTEIKLGSEKTHIISTHVQVLRFGGFNGGPLSINQRQRGVLEDHILDFNARPRRIRPLSSRGCVVHEAIQYYYQTQQQTKVDSEPVPEMIRSLDTEPAPETDLEGTLKVLNTDTDSQPHTPPPEYDSDDPSEHASPLDPRLSSPLIVTASGLDKDGDGQITPTITAKIEASSGSVLERLQRSMVALSPFHSK
ncbi:hypothetical protein BU24DRAFT_404571 [Aaosphaeria arxii CBS 175.79]|uniref:Uncharacterized protein n=1 Tax=Aaosphaeria arxii CBS 175.79 TaxID=1450172 RepID=A0A6A5Y7L9_9PLEO|nr:uncharacterized protein BU24DRAFT_404571 [Aaosphaeria arxii CBS 175.79]KAF2021565.1 hypothetical protein BU24DRAFT_404571 [Aaosphaeria arxii CBS 175.79]